MNLTKSMDMESSSGSQGISTKEVINMMKDTDMERCFSQMAQSIKETGKKAYNAEKVL
jgi:uncharacterized protein YjgD (DUF1641 family)